MGAKLDPSQEGNEGRKHPRKGLRGGAIHERMAGVGVGWEATPGENCMGPPQGTNQHSEVGPWKGSVEQ